VLSAVAIGGKIVTGSVVVIIDLIAVKAGMLYKASGRCILLGQMISIITSCEEDADPWSKSCECNFNLLHNFKKTPLRDAISSLMHLY